MEKINIAELLKDCPKGMELYSPLCGKCVFDRVSFGTIICKKQNTQEITFTHEGYYMLPVFDNCECMIFPSKDQRDWSKFQRPFKDGDIITDSLGTCIFKGESKFEGCVNYYCGISYGCFSIKDDKCNPWSHYGSIVNYRLSTEEEKQKLFAAIKENGYKWNEETKTLEKLVQPKFKVGYKVRHKDDKTVITITGIKDDYYFIQFYNIKRNDYQNEKVLFKDQDKYELVPNKFDITTLIPFESKVLVRDCNQHEWEGEIFTRYAKSFNNSNFVTLGGESWKQCIPYNDDTKHLLGTTDDCDDYYKTWE